MKSLFCLESRIEDRTYSSRFIEILVGCHGITFSSVPSAFLLPQVQVPRYLTMESPAMTFRCNAPVETKAPRFGCGPLRPYGRGVGCGPMNIFNPNASDSSLSSTTCYASFRPRAKTSVAYSRLYRSKLGNGRNWVQQIYVQDKTTAEFIQLIPKNTNGLDHPRLNKIISRI